MATADAPLRLTARDVLERFGGKSHAEHSVTWREKVSLSKSLGARQGFLIGCSCGIRLAVAATEQNLEGLRNVPEGKPS